MTDLRELYPMPMTVPFGNGTVEVKGLSLREIAALAHEHHDLIGMLSGGKIAVGALLTKAPDAALAIFAFGYVGPAARLPWWKRIWRSVLGDGLHQPPDDPHQAFDRLGFGQQADILGAIYDLTVGGKRAGPFLASVAAQLRLTDRPPSSEVSPSSSPSSPSSSAPPDTAETPAT